MSKNDDMILALKKQIEDKKSQLNKAKKFLPITNCSININNVQININTLQREGLIGLLIQLHSLQSSAIELELLDEYNISGYNISEWIEDLKNKLEVLSVKQEEAKLKQMESRLNQLLSNEKKTELELEEIINSMK